MADSLDIVLPDPSVERTPTFWLISQALELLNKEGKAAELAYSHVVELLKDRPDAVSGVFGLLHSSPSEDVGLRWGALHIAGDIGNLSAAEQLYQAAVESLPEQCKEEVGCEGPKDLELLIRTMAVEALQRVAARQPEAGELVIKLVAERPVQPVLIEAVKAARTLKLTDKVSEVLGKEDRWILDIKILPAEEIMAEPERGDDTSLGHMPPGRKVVSSSPNATCCTPREED